MDHSVLRRLPNAACFEWRENLAVTHADEESPEDNPWFLSYNQAQMLNKNKPFGRPLAFRLADHPVNVGPLLEMLCKALPGFEIELIAPRRAGWKWVVTYEKDDSPKASHEDGHAVGNSPTIAIAHAITAVSVMYIVNNPLPEKA